MRSIRIFGLREGRNPCNTLMSHITMEAGLLLESRRRLIRRLITPLPPLPTRVSIQAIGARKNAYVLAVVRSNELHLATLNPEQPLVDTKLQNILLNYHEIWYASPQGGIIILSGRICIFTLEDNQDHARYYPYIATPR